MEDAVDVDNLIDALIDREGGYVDHAADRGGPTCFGITRLINEKTSHDFEVYLADARVAAERLRLTAQAAANSGARGGASVPALPAAAGSATQAAGQDQLSPADALAATEQAI